MGAIYNRLQRMIFIPALSGVDHDAADREIFKNRFWLALACISYAALLYGTNRVYIPVIWLTLFTYFCVTSVLISVNLRSEAFLNFRRYFALALDVAAVSIAFATADIHAAPAFLLYLWLVVGHGFRYGIFLLRLASGLSLVGFGLAAIASPYWSRQPYIIASFTGTLLVIPGYIELLLRKLLKANTQAQDANHAKALMLAGLGHGLRTPLGYIGASADRLLSTKLELFQADLVNSIQVATMSLSSELDDFLDMSRIEAGHVAERRETFFTAQVVRNALKVVAAEAQSKKLQIAWHIAAGVPIELHADRAHFSKALGNLLHNAVKFTGAGYVSVYLCPATMADGKPGLRIEVADTGIGVERDAKEKIWQSYTQANREIFHTYGGAGLGLSVVRQLVRLMEGTVGAYSRVRSGSTFWFQIPILPRAEVEETAKWPSGLAVVFISSTTNKACPVVQQLRSFGGQVFLTDRAEYVLPAVANVADDVKRFVIVVDGREGDPVQAGYSLRFDAALSRVPLILLTDVDGTVTPEGRRVFVTAIAASATRFELIAALRIADNQEDSRMSTNESPPVDLGSVTPREGQVRVLIAERNLSNRVVLKRQVEASGHFCRAVEDGDQVTEAFAEADFDLVLVDIDMPKMNGFEASQMLHFMTAGASRLPVVGIADDITPGLRQRSVDAGMKALLSRPVTTAQIAALLEECLPASCPNPEVEGTQQDVVEALSLHPKFRAGKGPPLVSPTLSHLGLKVEPELRSEVRQAFQVDAQGLILKLREAVEESNIEKFRVQLQTIKGSAVTLGAAHLEYLCNEGRDYPPQALELQGRVLLQRIKSEIDRVDEQLKEAD